MSARRLVRDLDGLSFSRRQYLAASTARALPAAEFEALLDELYAGDEYERLVALQMAIVAGHRKHVQRSLDAPDRAVVVRAVVASVRLASSPDALVARVGSWPSAYRDVLCRAVRRYDARAIAEALLPVVRDRFDDHAAAGLLASCSAATVASALPDLGYAMTTWGPLARRHPTVFFDHLSAELTSTPHAEWPALLDRVGAGLAGIASTHADRVLDVLEVSAPYAPLPVALADRMGALARHDPERMLRIVLHPGRIGAIPTGRAFWRAMLGIDDADLVRLGRAIERGQLAPFLHVLPPSRRGAVFRGIAADRNLASSEYLLAALDELPGDARADFARLLLSRHRVADDPEARLAVTARLSWAESETALRLATRRPRAEERAEAYPLYLLAAAATRDPSVVERVIGALDRLPNEQEPVRAPAVQALARIPPWLFSSSAADDVGRLLRAAAQARDCSWSTRNAVRAVADRLLREGAIAQRPRLVDDAIATIEVLGASTRSLDLYGLDRGLPRGAEHRVFDALRARIEVEAKRGRFDVALALATGLGRRAWAMPGLQKVIDQARGARDDGVVRRAIELWLAPPATRDERLAIVLRADRSTITIGAVRDGIGRRRTDLLDEVLTKPLHGRFLGRRTRHIPPFERCFDRWLPRQRAKYVELLSGLATAAKLPVWERAQAVRQLGRVPAPIALMRAFLTDPQVQVVDAALAGLAWTAEPAEALSVLLEHVNTDRAHVAASAARTCARFVAPDVVAPAIATALRAGKVTARKEAVRLIGTTRWPGAMPLLGQLWADPDQHRDVRRTVVHAGWSYLDDERVWPILADAARRNDIATALLDVPPQSVAGRHRTRYAELVRSVAAADDVDTARAGLAALPAWIRWDGETSSATLVGIVCDLSATATWRTALAALVTGAEIAETATPLRVAVTTLLAAHADDLRPAFDAGEDRDQPARQRLEALATAVADSIGRRPILRSGAADLADALAVDPTCADIAVRLAVAAVPWDGPGDEIAQLRRVIELAGRPLLAREASEHLRGAVVRFVRSRDELRLLTVARALSQESGQSAAFVALAIVQAAGSRAGWTAPWRDLVRRYRRHDDPDVRMAAMQMITRVE